MVGAHFRPNNQLACKNVHLQKPECTRSYLSDDGLMVTNLVRDLRTAHDTNHPVNPPLALGQLAPLIYQNGELPCAGCGQVNDLAHHTGPGEPPGVNTLLENVELLQNHGILPGAA